MPSLTDSLRRAALLLPIALAACGPREAPQARYANLEALVASPATPRPGTAPATRARSAAPVASLPGWVGPVIGVEEQRDVDGFSQAITLRHAGGGEPTLAIVAGLSPGVDGAPGRPTEAGIRAELEKLFPDIGMQVVTRPGRNAYGPYGLAVGRRGDGTRCLYAWQWIDAAPVGPRDLPVSLRVRLCRANASLDALATAVDALRLTRSPEPITAAAAPQPRRRRASHAPKAAERAPRSTPVVAAAAPVAGVATSIADAAGRRYLAAPPVEALMPTSPAAASGGTRTLDAALPPEAFRGPVRR